MDLESLEHIRGEALLAEVDRLKLEIGALTTQLRQANEEACKLRVALYQAYGKGYAAAATVRILEARPEDMPDLDPMF